MDLKLRKECSRTLGPGMGWNLAEQLAGATSRCNRGAAVEADTIGEQQLKSGSSNWSGCNRCAAAEAEQLKRVNTIGEQQLKRTQLGSSSSAQRAVRHRITHIGEWGGSSWAREASEATCNIYQPLAERTLRSICTCRRVILLASFSVPCPVFVTSVLQVTWDWERGYYFWYGCVTYSYCYNFYW